jgi:site-specific DNA-methyltransferase (adenine-specific)
MAAINFVHKNQNKALRFDGLKLLSMLPSNFFAAVVFDPQYRQILEKLKYGNKNRQLERVNLPQMSDDTIVAFLNEISRCLKPSGYLFFWEDKFARYEGIHNQLMNRLDATVRLKLVDGIVWHKLRVGNGYRSRRSNEDVVIFQKKPYTIKNWVDKSIPDTWPESIENPRSKHTHVKPYELTKRLLLSVTLKGDYILDPCAGSFLTLDVSRDIGRNFVGCDIAKKYGKVKVT